jgi:hypothetical protein
MGEIDTEIDWVESNDYDMLSNVFAEINFVRQVTLRSQKCSIKDLVKLETDYSIDLDRGRFSSKVCFGRYIKEVGKLPED